MRTVKGDGVPVFHAYANGNMMIDVPFFTPFGRLLMVFWQGRYEPLRYVGPFVDGLNNGDPLGRAIVVDGRATEHVNLLHYTYQPILAAVLEQWGPGQYSPICDHPVRVPELCWMTSHGPQPNLCEHLQTFERMREEASLTLYERDARAHAQQAHR